MEGRHDRQNRHHGSAEGSAGRGREIHPGDHHPPFLRGMMELITSIAGAIYLTGLLFRLVDFIEQPKRKAPCATADQSKAQETI